MASSGLRYLSSQMLVVQSRLTAPVPSRLQKVRFIREISSHRGREMDSSTTTPMCGRSLFQCVPVRRYSLEGTLWDDSDWMKHGDSNAEAYEELDITKLRPFPEFRNVAMGPVWGPNAFEKVWKTYYDTQAPKHIVAQQDEEWQQFVADNGFSPIEYFDSDDYKERYGDDLIWTSFRRSHKGAVPPKRTRGYCLRFGRTGNPCPLCRDDKILINFRNLPLLLNFIEPSSGETYSTARTGVCRRKQDILAKAIWLARDQGTLPKPMNAFPSQNLDMYRCNHPAVSPK